MKKKLITVAICGVIGVTAMAGLSIYRNTEIKEQTQTLVEIPKKEEVYTKDSQMEGKQEQDLEKSIEVFKDSGQANGTNEDSVKSDKLDIDSTSKELSKDGQESIEPKEELKNPKNSNNSRDENNKENETELNSTVPSIQEEGMFNEQIEQFIFNKVNEERIKAGVPALSYNSTMETYARIKAKDMGKRNYFDHANPEGELITAAMARDGIGYNAWGENIAYISGISDITALADQFMTNWMNSEGHRANILSTNFESIGIGVYKVGDRYYATQEFYK